ncbi:MAG: hypothetical protein ABSC00_05405 [Acidimicrobiales bacterium]
MADSIPSDICHSLGSTAIAPAACLLIFGVPALYLFGVYRWNRLCPGAR